MNHLLEKSGRFDKLSKIFEFMRKCDEAKRKNDLESPYLTLAKSVTQRSPP